MRRTLGICVAASVALWLFGCGDDDSVCISCGEADSATDTSEDTESDTDESSTTGSTTSTQGSSTDEVGDSGTITIDAGSSETPDGGAVDAGSDSGTDAEAPETDDDGGASADAGDAGPVEESDAGDGGGSSPDLCAQMCATAAAAECEDYSTCEEDLCSLYAAAPNCTAEADAYFECVAATDGAESFECDEDDKPVFTSDECDEQYLIPWVICSGA